MAEPSAALVPELSHALAVWILLALRVAPTLFGLMWLVGARVLGVVIGLGFAASLLPLALAHASTPPALELGPQLWAAGAWELARGLCLGLGVALPLAAFGWAGRLSEAFGASPLGESAARGRGLPPMAALYAGGALALAFSTTAHLLLWRALLGSLADTPLGSAAADRSRIHELPLELARLAARALSLSLVLSLPVLVCVACVALVLGLAARSARPLGAISRGPLLPWVGLSAACLTVSSILGELPQALRVFVDRTLALLRGLG
jgi:flagellar biosynthesis protein FliR